MVSGLPESILVVQEMQCECVGKMETEAEKRRRQSREQKRRAAERLKFDRGIGRMIAGWKRRPELDEVIAEWKR